MSRHSCIAMMVAGIAVSGMVGQVQALEGADVMMKDANKAVAIAAAAVEQARVAIENGKQLVVLIPEDSEFVTEVKSALLAASENWNAALVALNGAKESASKISTATTPEIAQDYQLLATVNAGVALSGAKVVMTGLSLVDAVANNKTESLGIIRMSMRDSLAAASQVRFNYERVKKLIAGKYSK